MSDDYVAWEIDCAHFDEILMFWNDIHFGKLEIVGIVNNCWTTIGLSTWWRGKREKKRIICIREILTSSTSQAAEGFGPT
jgi:hypothetical protein